MFRLTPPVSLFPKRPDRSCYHQTPIRWMPGVLSAKVKCPGHNLDTRLKLMPQLRMNAAIPALLNVRVQIRVHLSFMLQLLSERVGHNEQSNSKGIITK